MNHPLQPSHSRRSFLGAMLAAGTAPMFAPSRVFGAGDAPPPSDKICVGILGAGEQGRADMINFLGQPDVRVTAICDVNQRNIATAREILAKHYGKDEVKVYTDFREFNADPKIDAIVMALPVHWHSIPSIDAVLHGKPMYHEKPVAMSFEESRRLRAVLRKKPVAFQFGTQQRSDLKFRWACELARNGRVGKLREIHVSVPAGGVRPAFPEQAAPGDIDWDRWVGPAPMTPFHEEKLNRAHHENITNFSLGMISCWGIHHLDIAQWGNDTDGTGPASVEGSGEFPPPGGGYDAIWRWKVRFEYERAAPIVFVSDGTPGFQHGVRFIGESGWVHVLRGEIHASDPELLRNPQNKCGTMPIKLPVSLDHRRDFLDAIRHGRPTICGIESSVRGDTLCHLSLISIHQGRKLKWDPQAETFPDDEGARLMLAPRPFRGDWKLQDV